MDANRTTEERVSDDRLQELIDVYDGQAFRGDFVLALQELQRLRHYVATCGGTDNDGRCPMHHLAGVSHEPAAELAAELLADDALLQKAIALYCAENITRGPWVEQGRLVRLHYLRKAQSSITKGDSHHE